MEIDYLLEYWVLFLYTLVCIFIFLLFWNMKKLTLITSCMTLLFLTACSTQPQDVPANTVPADTVPTQTNSTADTPVTTTTTDTTVKTYSLSDVNTHATTKDCRTAVNGKVYDITSAFGKHKGGDEALMKLCGKEWTALFTQQHGTNEKAKGFLTTLLIWDLK